MTNQEIITRGELIRDETVTGANTAQRVGEAFVAIGENLQELDRDLGEVQESLTKSSSTHSVRLANLERGAVNGITNKNADYDESVSTTIRIRSVNSFLSTASTVKVVAKSKSGNYYPRISQYNACDSNGTAVAIMSNSDAKWVGTDTVSNVNEGVYIRFLIKIFTDPSYNSQFLVNEITPAILNDIYVSNEESVGLKFDNSNSSLEENTEIEYYNVGEIDERLEGVENEVSSLNEAVEQLHVDTSDIESIKEILSIPSDMAVRRVLLERGGISGNSNQPISYDTSNGKRLRSIGKFLTTGSTVKVVPKSKSGNLYPKISQYNACDADGIAVAIVSGSTDKFVNGTSVSNVNVGVYVRFVIRVYSDSSYSANSFISNITDEIFNDIYIDDTDSQGVLFDDDNSRAVNKFYNITPVHDAITEEVTISVNGTKPAQDFSTVNTTPDNDDFYNITGKLWIPKSNNKCKLVISFPGGGASPDTWYIYMNHGAILNALGYAVYIPTGYSIAWYNAHSVTVGYAPIGSWMALEEVTKGYQYIMDRYGSFIDGNCVFAYGESQGGMVAENAMEQSGIPFKGGVLDAPAISMQYAQMYLSSRASCIEALYGLSNHVFDKTKCVGCDPFTRNMSEDIVMTESENFSTKPTIDLSSITAKKFRSTNCPLFIMVGNTDATVSPYVQKAYAKAVMNAGEWCKLKVYNCGHGVIQYTNIIGTCDEKTITAGLADVLSFFKRCGGYDYTITPNE